MLSSDNHECFYKKFQTLSSSRQAPSDLRNPSCSGTIGDAPWVQRQDIKSSNIQDPPHLMGAKCKTTLVSKVKGMLDVLEEVDKDFELVKVSFQRWAGLCMTESCVSSLKKSAKDFNSRFSQAPAAVGPQP